MTPPRARTKQSAKLSNALQRNLSLYAFAASAAGVQLLALAPVSEAEVVYTPAHTFIGSNRSFSFDLNHDGINDFTIENLCVRTSSYVGCRLEIRPDQGGAIAYNVKTDIWYLAADFPKDATIGVHERFEPNVAAMERRFAFYGTLHRTYGYWLNVHNGYLGLVFGIDGEIHYGWARLDVRSNGYKLHTLLTGYAYETQPDTPIIAGDTGGASDEQSHTEPIIRVPQPDQSGAMLGALSLGAPGLAIWRRPTS